jgi:hypothetical protein
MKMTKTASRIRFKAKLCRPVESAKTRSWSFLVLPKNASAKLPSRGMTAIEGTLNGFPFQATLEPDGRKSHWLKVDRKLSEAAGAEVGDFVTLDIAPTPEEPERCPTMMYSTAHTLNQRLRRFPGSAEISWLSGNTPPTMLRTVSRPPPAHPPAAPAEVLRSAPATSPTPRAARSLADPSRMAVRAHIRY